MIHILENDRFKVVTDNGVITEIYDKTEAFGTNLVKNCGSTGLIKYTYISDDVSLMNEDGTAMPYHSRVNSYDTAEQTEKTVLCIDSQNRIYTEYALEDDSIIITSHTENDEISEFSLSLDMNFMGNVGTDYKKQFLPTSPYTSYDGKFTYCIMPRCEGDYVAVTSQNECAGWKIDYSFDCLGHYIDGFRISADFDKTYQKTARHRLKVRLIFEKSPMALIEKISEIYGVPYVVNVLSGGFEYAEVETSEGCDMLEIIAPSGKSEKIYSPNKQQKIQMNEYGLHTVVPYQNEIRGMNTTIWYGEDFDNLFQKSCDSIKKPYHGDVNLCEGGMFLHALLIYTRKYNDLRYIDTIKRELGTLMGEGNAKIKRWSILPYKTQTAAPYHIYESDRIQEQFAGITILIEAYRVFNDEKYLEFAVNSLYELTNNNIDENGGIWRYSGTVKEDYTTVCAPVITIADMAITLKNNDDIRYRDFEKAAIKVADYLVERNENFPTEGVKSKHRAVEMEDGSISCTALSVLYVCKNIKYDKKYIDFAEKILNLHKAWTIYTPDARMYQSSFRWWETIWEGDCEGPAICAGHAWALWRAEALFWYGILTGDSKSLIDSWNGFITNFSKINSSGESYACFEADFIRGGGYETIKRGQLQLQGESYDRKFILAHSFPMHKDNSLSRYVWNVYDRTWGNQKLLGEIENGMFK